MTPMTIGDLSNASGVPARTIRFYEAKGLLPHPPRSEGGYRLYGGEDLQRLAFIRRSRALGLKLADIRRLVHVAEQAPCASYQEELTHALTSRLAEVERLMGELAQAREGLTGLLGYVSNQEWGDCQQTALTCCTEGACLGA